MPPLAPPSPKPRWYESGCLRSGIQKSAASSEPRNRAMPRRQKTRSCGVDAAHLAPTRSPTPDSSIPAQHAIRACNPDLSRRSVGRVLRGSPRPSVELPIPSGFTPGRDFASLERPLPSEPESRHPTNFDAFRHRVAGMENIPGELLASIAKIPSPDKASRLN